MVSSHTQNRNLKIEILREIMDGVILILMDDKKHLDPIRISDLRTVQTIVNRLKVSGVEVRGNRKVFFFM
jgi:hypothetical protein